MTADKFRALATIHIAEANVLTFVRVRVIPGVVTADAVRPTVTLVFQVV